MRTSCHDCRHLACVRAVCACVRAVVCKLRGTLRCTKKVERLARRRIPARWLVCERTSRAFVAFGSRVLPCLWRTALLNTFLIALARVSALVAGVDAAWYFPAGDVAVSLEGEYMNLLGARAVQAHRFTFSFPVSAQDNSMRIEYSESFPYIYTSKRLRNRSQRSSMHRSLVGGVSEGDPCSSVYIPL